MKPKPFREPSPNYTWDCVESESDKEIYGALYNGFAVETNKLSPKGWHVPSLEEWQKFIDFLGGEHVAGGKLKEQGMANWLSLNTGATNEVGFNAMPRPCVFNYDILFHRSNLLPG